MPGRPFILIAAAVLTGCGGGGSDVDRIIDVTLGADYHRAAAAMDANGDGLQDIVSVSHILNTNDAYLNVFTQAVGGDFSPKIRISLGDGSTRRVEDVVTADLDLDGLPDAVVAHLGLTTAGVTPGREVSVLLKDGVGAADFAPYRSYTVADNPYRLAVADLDMDGLPDIAVASSGGTHVLFQDGGDPGRFLDAVRVDAGQARGVAIDDLTGDGLPDVVAAGAFGVRLMANDSVLPGTFVPAGSWPTPTEAGDLVLADINADGALDFAVALSRSDTFDRAGIAYQLQDPVFPAQFGAQVEVTFPGVRYVSSLDADDLNGDGRVDLVAAVSGPPDEPAIAVLIADPVGLRAPAFYDSTEPLGPWMALIAQLGPDDIADVVLAYSTSGVHVHYGTGNGVFEDAVKIGD
ncbi:MAG TPA: VCBS repeat-containing protein [Pseudomonadales bacterium]